MENAVDALKIAFAVMVFVIALSVSIMSFNSVKAAADSILYTKDETNYYEYQGAVGKASENRIVGMETVVPTLYRYYKENFTVVFKQADYTVSTGQFSNVDYLYVYTTPSKKNLWADSYKDLMNEKYGKNGEEIKIFSFDLVEETLRNEPWTASVEKTKSNLDAFLNGSTFLNPSDNSDYKNYKQESLLSNKGFIQKYKDSKFVETIGEYVYNSGADKSDIGSYTKEKTKRVITFTLINNIV